jgi:hypothetical protein
MAPETPGRAALAEAIAAVDEARETLAAALQPVQRLQGIIADLGRTERDLAALDRDHDRVVGEWLASGSIGEKPLPPAHRLGLAQRRDQLLPDAAAAESALPAARARELTASEECRHASERLAEAIPGAARDAACLLYPVLREKLEQFLTIEGQLRGLETVLRIAGNQDGAPSAWFVAADAIQSSILSVKRSAGVRIDLAGAEALLAVLPRDPNAVLA